MTSETFWEIVRELIVLAPEIALDVAVAVSPIIVVFVVYQYTLLRLPKSKIISMAAGMGYSFIGLVLFFLGLEIGFTDTGKYLGEAMGALPNNWVLVPIGFFIGLAVVLAEPAVRSLVRQVRVVTGGMISERAIYISLCSGVALSVAIAMARAIWRINIWYIIAPGYLAALILTRYTNQMFTAIAFDSGGVASGPMTSTFVLMFTVGVSSVADKTASVGEAFGVVAMVAMTPLITIQILGLIYARRMKQIADETSLDDEVLDLDMDEEAAT